MFNFENNLAIYMNYNFDITNPSVRLRRINLRRPLRMLKINSDIIYRFEDLLNYKNILISHFNKETFEQCVELKKLGKRLFYCHSEAIFGYSYQKEVFEICNYIVCCSDKLAELTEQWLKSPITKCVVIEDMVEQFKTLHQPSQKDKLTCCYVGMGGNSYLAKSLKPIIKKAGMDLIIISEHDDADIKWKRETYLEEMSRFDIAICPQNTQAQPAKSAIKVTVAMSIGLPVVCSPNPAYLKVVNSGINGFVANNDEEWLNALNRLKNLNLRKNFSLKGLETAQNFTPQAIAKKWVDLLSIKRTHIALINNTLPQKYLSYGDHVLDKLRMSGFQVTEFRYEDIDILPNNFDVYLFIEVRYEPEDISNIHPRILYTREEQNLNNLAHFDLVVTPNRSLGKKWINRGFVNVEIIENWDAINPEHFASLVNEENFLVARQKHNFDLHSKHINAFYSLQPPEERWTGGSRDQLHIKWTMEQTHDEASILDIGSADGWLALYLATQNRNVSALEFVKRGMDWTNQNAKRLGVNIDLRYGFIEKVDDIFSDKKFDYILAFEILEHLDYRRIPWYLEKMEKILAPGGKILITLPKQDLHDNPEHLFSPNINLIDKLFKNRHNYQCQWIDIPNHGIPGNWFISYEKEA